ncbi:hypothetical protein MNBD_ALPHA12-842 [hydrothermal vent metagenome]|uniref:Uncharacterized protein n=1 Tax=hydrothermal vent metagenome TaxID=652676 RepID=A0A3B0TN31_9ZZZZ
MRQSPGLEMACNCLYSRQDMTGIMAGLVVGSSAGRIGNWGAGTLRCFETQMIFSSKPSRRPFKKTAAPLVIKYHEITGVRLGSMMFVAKTVDIDAGAGKVRFRAWGENNQLLHRFLLEKTDQNPL